MAWFDQYLRPKCTFDRGPGREPRVFLTGDDCYALRCALLHEGSADITGQPARKVLERFHFCTPGTRNNVWHCNHFNGALILMVDHFAAEVLNAARLWWKSLTDDERAAARACQLTLVDTDTMQGI